MDKLITKTTPRSQCRTIQYFKER